MRIRTVFFLTLLTILIMWVGRVLGGPQGMMIALMFALLMNFGSYWFSDKIVLAMYGAKPLSESEAPQLYQIVRELAMNAELPMPRICLIPQDTPNAFATGRNPENAVVAVTRGLLQVLDYEEVRGVLAHELAHIKNRDILIGSIAATLAGAIMMLADMARWAAIFGGFGRRDDDEGGGLIGLLVISIVAPIAALLIQMAISRSREYLADETGAKFARSSQGLASALEKLALVSRKIPMANIRPATAHLFIVNPLTAGGMMALFSTHPPIEERIKRLRALPI